MTQARREVRVPAYWVVVGLVVMLVSPLLSILASVQIANSNRERADAAAAKAAAAAREESRVRTCGLFAALLDAYVEEPPPSATGRRIQQTYLSFYALNHCQPPRTK